MLKANRLLAIMALFGDNHTTLAKKLNIGRPSLTKKINNKLNFKIPEIKKIKHMYHLTARDIEDIFFY